MELVEFLRQRLDEDEAAAKAWLPIGNPDAAQREHIARHDPARVLREVDSKRRIVEQYEAMQAGVEAAAGTILAGAAKVRLGAYKFALKCLALPYADHPDYDEKWRS
jgi:hypothetical protein